MLCRSDHIIISYIDYSALILKKKVIMFTFLEEITAKFNHVQFSNSGKLLYWSPV